MVEMTTTASRIGTSIRIIRKYVILMVVRSPVRPFLLQPKIVWPANTQTSFTVFLLESVSTRQMSVMDTLIQLVVEMMKDWIIADKNISKEGL